MVERAAAVKRILEIDFVAGLTKDRLEDIEYFDGIFGACGKTGF
jgi:hypothetical protein